MANGTQKQQNEVAELTAKIALLQARVEELDIENRKLIEDNKLLQQKNAHLLKIVFGRKSEKYDPRQLDILADLFGDEEPESSPEKPANPPAPPAHPRKARPRKPRIPENLPVEEIILIPDEVQSNPDAYKEIGEEVTQELDLIPPQYFCRRFIRKKFVMLEKKELPPIIVNLPPRFIEGGYASPGLVTDILLKKYLDHLPLYRQERILMERFGIDLSRKTMCDWVWVAANWLRPIYEHIREDLQKSGYLQIDETPVRYCQAEGGGSALGYIWLYHHPGGDVLYEWHTSRAAECLEVMLKEFEGRVQSDGYNAYSCYAKQRNLEKALEIASDPDASETDKANPPLAILLSGCWAHARRKFNAALEESPKVAGWFMNQIGLLYRIERRLREQKYSPVLREAARASESRMILERIEKAMKRLLSHHRPKSLLGKAFSYALGLWEELLAYCEDGRLEIDNNLVENAVRPTALGKKNWMFIGHPEAGERSAIIYTILESCRRHGINPQEYLRDVLTRLPSMTNQQTRSLTPSAWAANQGKQAA